jgi:aminoglycoside phosphotransferase (APT) family kinase protein
MSGISPAREPDGPGAAAATDADRIARCTGPYNLPGGVVPVVDGIPRWPWDEAVARHRLAQVAKLASMRLTGDEVFVESGSNDTWFLSGETVLQVCYRGDVDRLVREAELLAVLPGGVPGPVVLDYGRDRLMSWIVVKRVHAGTLWQAWPREPADRLRSYVSQLARIMRSLHSWQPPAHVLARYAAAECPPTETNPVTIAASTLTPLSAGQLGRLIEHARAAMFTDQDVLDKIAARLAEVTARITISRDADVVLHGDCTPANVLVQDGRVVALLDFEWSRRGPRDIEVTLPAFSAWAGGPPMLPWLAEDYPELFQVPGFGQRQWLYRVGFALRGLIHWPAFAPEPELPKNHGLRQLRHLAEGPAATACP